MILEKLNKTFMMISNWKKPFGCDVFHKLIQRIKAWIQRAYNYERK